MTTNTKAASTLASKNTVKKEKSQSNRTKYASLFVLILSAIAIAITSLVQMRNSDLRLIESIPENDSSVYFLGDKLASLVDSAKIVTILFGITIMTSIIMIIITIKIMDNIYKGKTVGLYILFLIIMIVLTLSLLITSEVFFKKFTDDFSSKKYSNLIESYKVWRRSFGIKNNLYN